MSHPALVEGRALVAPVLSLLSHALAFFALGWYFALHPAPETPPELDISSVSLTLEDEAPETPAIAAALPVSPREVPPPPEEEASPVLPEPETALPPVPSLPPPKLQLDPDAIPLPPVPAPRPKPKPPRPAPSRKPAPLLPASSAPPLPASSPVVPSGGSSGKIDAPPRPLRMIKPHYPVASRRRGEEGTVTVRLTISSKGDVTDAAVVSSSGFPELDHAARTTCLQTRFKPGQRGGRDAESTALLTLRFLLRDN